MYFYPRSPCGERQQIHLEKRWLRSISIHALLAESDVLGLGHCFGHNTFLSTLSLRRATSRTEAIATKIGNFYPRSPCGERHNINSSVTTADKISIHALLAESDFTTTITICTVSKFLSTLSLRRATHYDNYNLHCVEISIHALLAESDGAILKLQCILGNFYPRSPCGERLNEDRYGQQFWRISIHALLAESDIISPHSTPDNGNFYPRSPCGERHGIIDIINNVINDFYPRSPCGERRLWACPDGSACLFLSTLSLRRATANGGVPLNSFINFYPRSPCGERLLPS